MKRNRTFKKLLALVLALTCICVAVPSYSASEQDDRFISQATAEKVAVAFATSAKHVDETSAWPEKVTASSSELLYDFDELPCAYYVSLQDEAGTPCGYVVVSANQKEAAVLEYQPTAEASYFDKVDKAAASKLSQSRSVKKKYYDVRSNTYYVADAGSDTVIDITSGKADYKVSKKALKEEWAEQKKISKQTASSTDPSWEMFLARSSPSGSSYIENPSQYESGYSGGRSYSLNLYGGTFVDSSWYSRPACGPTAALNLLIYWARCKGYSSFITEAYPFTSIYNYLYDTSGTSGSSTSLGNLQSALQSYVNTKYPVGSSDFFYVVNDLWVTQSDITSSIESGIPLIYQVQGSTVYGNHFAMAYGFQYFTYSSRTSYYIRIMDGHSTSQNRYVHFDDATSRATIRIFQ